MLKLGWFSTVRPPGGERRCSGRFPCFPRITGRILLGQERRPEWVMVRNLSVAGVGLVLHSEIEPGQVVQVQFRHHLRRFACQVPVRIVYVEPHPSGVFVAGGAFARKLTGKEIVGLL